MNSEDGTPVPVSGTARGSVDKLYFVRIDIHFADPRSGEKVEGTSVIGQTGGRGIEMSNSFSSSPTIAHFRGEMDASGTLFDLKQFAPERKSRRVILRLGPGTDWKAEVWDGSKQLESYQFSRVDA
jgi:hypothetical protein